jgi:hypothetical protein
MQDKQTNCGRTVDEPKMNPTKNNKIQHYKKRKNIQN